MSDKLYTAHDIATILGRTVPAIEYHLRRLRIVPNAKHGYSRYFDHETVRRLMLATGVFRDLNKPALDWLEVAVDLNITFEQQYISAGEAAHALGYEVRYLALILKLGDGPKTQLFSNRRYYLRDELLTWIEHNRPDRLEQFVTKQSPLD